MKKIMILLFSAICIIVLSSPIVFADNISLTAKDDGNGLVSVQCNQAMNGTLSYALTQNGKTVFSSQIYVAGQENTQIGLPVRRLPYSTYNLNIKYLANGSSLASVTTTVAAGTENPIITGGNNDDYRAGTIGSIKAVLTPYAKVYATSALTGTPVVELKRHDLVQIISSNNGVAQVKCHIQSGNGTIQNIDRLNAEYQSDDDLIAEGYIDMSAFVLPTSKYETDIAREVLEVAYTRLGTRGVYSQAKRFIDFYLDCSAFASWSWYQIGVDMSAYGTNCNGLVRWADNQSQNVILWEAEEDKDGAIQEIWDEIHATYDYTEDGQLVHGHDSHVYFNNNEYNETAITKYTTNITQEVYEAMRPGDLIFFNYSKNQTDTNGHSYGSYPVNEGGDRQGLDHVAIFVGLRNGVAVVLESSSPSTDPGQNTKVTEMPLAGGKVKNAVMVVRPTGCDTLLPE